MKDLFIS